jgi:hypothetical protein
MKAELYTTALHYKGAFFFQQDIRREMAEPAVPVLERFTVEHLEPGSYRLSAMGCGWTYVEIAFNDNTRRWEVAVTHSTNPDAEIIDALVARFRSEKGLN